MAKADALIDIYVFRKKVKGKKSDKSTKPGKGAGKTNKKKHSKGDKGKGKVMEESSLKDPKTQPGCFICNGPQHAYECPKREKLMALINRTDFDHDDEQTRVAPLQILGAIQSGRKVQDGGLMYILMTLNAKRVAMMVDTSITHNFVLDRVMEAYGLQVQKQASWTKAVNSQSRPMLGMAKGV